MNFIVDKAKAEKKWSPILEALHVEDVEKRSWISEYAELHQMNENVSYGTLGNIQGMGAVVSPQPSTIPGSVWGADATPGSGDVGQNLLPISMKIAAQTIGLDLVAVKPAASPKVDLLFVDFRYDDPNENEDGDRPLVFKMASTNATAIQAALYAQMTALSITEMVGGLDKRMFVAISGLTVATVLAAEFTTTPPTTKTGWMEFLGFSRIDGLPMFRIFRQAVERGMYPGTADTTKNTFPNDNTSIVANLENTDLLTLVTGATVAATDMSGVTIELVSLMEDHIPGFSAGWNLFKGMNRDQDENTYPGQIGPNVFTKTIQVGDVEITSALKRTEIEDIKASTGMDIVQKLESVLINELSQTISKEIVEAIKKLAELNKASHTTPKVAGVSKFDFDVDAYITGTAPGGETSHALQRKLISKINNASNYIANEGRVGPAQYVVTNGNLASVVQDIAGYTLNPIPGGSNLNTNGQLYPVGKIGQMTLYVDPYMRWDDNRMFLGRKNSVDQPGLLFLPYLMAQSISLISEATWAPRMLIRSRYAVADIGFFPEKQFMAIKVTDVTGYLI
jgi:major capsid protein Gp23